MHYRQLIIAFILEHKPQVVGVLLLSLMANLMQLLLPIYVAQSFQLLFGISSHRAQMLAFLPASVTHSITGYLFGFAILLSARIAFDFAQRYGLSLIGEMHLKDMRNRLFEHQLKVAMPIYDQRGFGKYLLRYSGDLNSIQAFLGRGLVRFVSDLFFILLMLLILYDLHIMIGATMTLMLLLMTVLIYILDRSLHQASLVRRNAKSGLLRFVAQRLPNMPTIRTFNRFVPEMHRFTGKTQRLLDLGKDYHRITSTIGTLIPAGLYLMIAAFMATVAWLQHRSPGEVEADAFFLTLLLLLTALPVFRRCFRVSMVWRNGSISYHKLTKILNLAKEESIQKPGLKIKHGEVAIHNLSFSHTKDRDLLEQVNIVLPAGSLALVHGCMGSGKSTLFKLITGIYQPDSGRILLDKQDVSHYSLKSRRRGITVVDDDCALLGDTIFQAISYSRKAKYRDLAERKLQQWFPDGRLHLDSRLSEGSCNLSKGDIRKLQYIRAELTGKKIWLIDEPFAHLDGQGRAQVCALLQSLGNHTVIVASSNTQALPFSFDVCICLDQSHSNLSGRTFADIDVNQ